MASDEKPVIEIPLDRFDRLLKLLERVANNQDRALTQAASNRARALAKTGPTSDEARAAVRRKMRKASSK